MRRIVLGLSILILLAAWAGAAEAPLGLPKVPIPKDNPLTPEKIQLGDKLFHDERFSTTGKVSCATCHAKDKAFTDNLPVSEGIDQLKGTRNAPTVLNAAYSPKPILGRPGTFPRGAVRPAFSESGGDGAEESRAHSQDRPHRPGIRPDV